MIDNKFNNYSLTDKEISKIIHDFEKVMYKHTLKLGEHQEDCIQEIKFQIYKTLTKNRKNKKIKNF